MNSDLISRRAAIEALGEIHPLDYNGQSAKARIEKLPATPDTSKAWVVQQHELTDECIEKIADAVVRKMRGEDDGTDEE